MLRTLLKDISVLTVFTEVRAFEPRNGRGSNTATVRDIKELLRMIRSKLACRCWMFVLPTGAQINRPVVS